MPLLRGQADRWRRDPRGHHGMACIRQGVRASCQECFPPFGSRGRLSAGSLSLRRDGTEAWNRSRVSHWRREKLAEGSSPASGAGRGGGSCGVCRPTRSPLDDASPDRRRHGNKAPAGGKVTAQEPGPWHPRATCRPVIGYKVPRVSYRGFLRPLPAPREAPGACKQSAIKWIASAGSP